MTRGEDIPELHISCKRTLLRSVLDSPLSWWPEMRQGCSIALFDIANGSITQKGELRHRNAPSQRTKIIKT